MVLPRKWKVVASAMSAAVAFSATSAIAQEGEDEEAESSTVIEEAVDISTLTPLDASVESAVATLLQADDEPEVESPFDSAISAESVEEESQPSVESESIPSAESVSVESAESVDSPDSVDSPESVDSVSVPSAESVSVESSD